MRLIEQLDANHSQKTVEPRFPIDQLSVINSTGTRVFVRTTGLDIPTSYNAQLVVEPYEFASVPVDGKAFAFATEDVLQLTSTIDTTTNPRVIIYLTAGEPAPYISAGTLRNLGTVVSQFIAGGPYADFNTDHIIFQIDLSGWGGLSGFITAVSTSRQCYIRFEGSEDGSNWIELKRVTLYPAIGLSFNIPRVFRYMRGVVKTIPLLADTATLTTLTGKVRTTLNEVLAQDFNYFGQALTKVLKPTTPNTLDILTMGVEAIEVVVSSTPVAAKNIIFIANAIDDAGVSIGPLASFTTDDGSSINTVQVFSNLQSILRLQVGSSNGYVNDITIRYKPTSTTSLPMTQILGNQNDLTVYPTIFGRLRSLDTKTGTGSDIGTMGTLLGRLAGIYSSIINIEPDVDAIRLLDILIQADIAAMRVSENNIDLNATYIAGRETLIQTNTAGALTALGTPADIAGFFSMIGLLKQIININDLVRQYQLHPLRTGLTNSAVLFAHPGGGVWSDTGIAIGGRVCVGWSIQPAIVNTPCGLAWGPPGVGPSGFFGIYADKISPVFVPEYSFEVPAGQNMFIYCTVATGVYVNLYNFANAATKPIP